MHATFGSVTGLRDVLVEAGVRPGADSGEPRTTYAELFAAAGTEVGVWTCTPGGWAIENRGDTEVVVVLTGRAAITDADGTRTEVGPNDVFVLPAGWSGRWDILEPLEKLYITIEAPLKESENI